MCKSEVRLRPAKPPAQRQPKGPHAHILTHSYLDHGIFWRSRSESGVMQQLCHFVALNLLFAAMEVREENVCARTLCLCARV